MTDRRIVLPRNKTEASAVPAAFGGVRWTTVVVISVLVALVLTLAGPVRTYLGEQAREDRVRAENSQLLADITELEAQRALQNDPAYVRQQARIRLQYVMPGETPYRVQFPGPPAPTPEQIEAEQARQNPWYTNVWRTIAVPS